MRTLQVMIYLTLLAGLAAACGALPQGVTITINNVPTQDVNQIVQATFQAMTQRAGGVQSLATQTIPTAQPVSSATQAIVPILAPTLAPAAATGSISGTLMYPASGIPAMRIVAFSTTDSSVNYTDTTASQSSYTLDVIAV